MIPLQAQSLKNSISGVDLKPCNFVNKRAALDGGDANTLVNKSSICLRWYQERFHSDFLDCKNVNYLPLAILSVSQLPPYPFRRLPVVVFGASSFSVLVVRPQLRGFAAEVGNSRPSHLPREYYTHGYRVRLNFGYGD